MSIRISGLLLAAALALTVTAAEAAEMDMDSANYMMPGCRDFIARSSREDLRFLHGYCLGLVTGFIIMGGGVSKSAAAAADAPGLCLKVPADVTLVKGIQVVIAYIDAHPARMNEGFHTLILEALRDAWPCK